MRSPACGTGRGSDQGAPLPGGPRACARGAPSADVCVPMFSGGRHWELLCMPSISGLRHQYNSPRASRPACPAGSSVADEASGAARHAAGIPPPPPPPPPPPGPRHLAPHPTLPPPPTPPHATPTHPNPPHATPTHPTPPQPNPTQPNPTQPNPTPQLDDEDDEDLEPLRTLVALHDWGAGAEGRARLLAYLREHLDFEFDDEVGLPLLQQGRGREAVA
jgi:hypothetical protein